MAAAQKGDTVRVHYTGKLTDGTVFDSSVGNDPLEFIVGSEQVIAGFDRAVLGMVIGAKTSVTVPVADAYGPRKPGLVIEVERSEFPPEIEPVVGLNLRMEQPDGSMVNVAVTKVEGTLVTLDANHPLAGEDLVFDIELVEIVAA